jgi:hypothetical protein
MIRIILTFLAVWGAVFFGFSYFWHVTRAEKLNMVKMAGYSLVTALVSMFVLVGIVVLF